MNGPHMAFAGHMAHPGDPSSDDMTPMPLDFGLLMPSDPRLASFEYAHGSANLGHQHMHRPVLGDKMPISNLAHHQQLPSAGPRRPPAQALLNGRHMAASTVHSTHPPPMDHGQSYTWENIFNASGIGHPPFNPAAFAFGKNDAASECGSACEGSCPSQCGDAGHGVCCDDDDCRGPQMCLDDACRGADQACTDESCLTETVQGSQPEAGPAMTDIDKEAAAALASFGENPLLVVPSGYLQASPVAPPPPSRDGPFPYANFPPIIPCGSLSMESMFPNSADAFQNQQYQMAFEYALANHIMQYHDPSQGLAHAGNCVANDPSQLISRCTLPKFQPNDNADPYLAQLQGRHECGFQVQSPDSFAHHILQEHRHALVVPPSQNPRFPDAVQNRPHANCRSPHPRGQHTVGQAHIGRHLAHGKPFSPSPSPLASMSMGSSWSTATSSLATPSPHASDTGIPEPSPAGVPQSTHRPLTPQASLADDQFVCRWLAPTGGICGRRFDGDEELQKHCKIDHLKQLKKSRGGFRCGWENCARDTCFTQRSKVERHMQVHTGFKPVQCSICGAALSAKQALDQHMRIHTGETPWICKYPGCGCAFKQQSALTMHERTHSGDKPLECEICGKRFSESSNLSKHRRTHNVKGMHECQLCGKDFHRLDQLRRHMGSNHRDRPAEVDAILSKAMNRLPGARKVSKMPRKVVKKGESEYITAKTLELMEDDLPILVLGPE
ncbi:putative metalloregulatory protein [Drechmeria coniospora]|uniref:Putative metalloregulatory protein n=1 Tax=Drechmeria coniospora TaxID=98403 RepID=A0A151GET2_DRECN|nr:putative metalloregulatory protein [Drechmeria coniospora]KYK55607.1 putative metalloregulatory protein [Drechmeria coniospora]